MIEEREFTGVFSIKIFYVRRVFRIWPLYFTVLFFSFVIYPFIAVLGKYTFALYMLHPIGIQMSIILFRHFGVQRDDNFLLAILYALIAFIVGMIMAKLSYRFVESNPLKNENCFIDDYW